MPDRGSVSRCVMALSLSDIVRALSLEIGLCCIYICVNTVSKSFLTCAIFSVCYSTDLFTYGFGLYKSGD